jgi:hypothetical protein
VILIQGDHGPKGHLDQDSSAGSDLNEVFGILSAYRVPPEVRTLLYPGITPVNSFRAILDGLFGEHLPFLPDKSYFSPWTKPLSLEDVTGRLGESKSSGGVQQRKGPTVASILERA